MGEVPLCTLGGSGSASVGLAGSAVGDMMGVRYMGTSLIRNSPPPPRVTVGP